MTIQDIYQLLFGKNHIQDGNVIDMSEHGRVGGVSTGQGFKIVSQVDGLPPTTGNNPSATLTYDGSGNLSTITKVIDGVSYQKTLTYAGNVLTDISAWVQL